MSREVALENLFDLEEADSDIDADLNADLKEVKNTDINKCDQVKQRCPYRFVRGKHKGEVCNGRIYSAAQTFCSKHITREPVDYTYPMVPLSLYNELQDKYDSLRDKMVPLPAQDKYDFPYGKTIKELSDEIINRITSKYTSPISKIFKELPDKHASLIVKIIKDIPDNYTTIIAKIIIELLDKYASLITKIIN